MLSLHSSYQWQQRPHAYVPDSNICSSVKISSVKDVIISFMRQKNDSPLQLSLCSSVLCVYSLTALLDNRNRVEKPRHSMYYTQPFTGLTERSCSDILETAFPLFALEPATVCDAGSVYRTESIVFWIGL